MNTLWTKHKNNVSPLKVSSSRVYSAEGGGEGARLIMIDWYIDRYMYRLIDVSFFELTYVGNIAS